MATYLPDIRRGDTYRIKIQYPAGTDITGYRHTFTVREDYDSVSSVISATSVSGEANGDDPVNGLAFVVVPAADTRVAVGKYVYNLELITQAGEVKTLVPPTEEYKDPIRVVPDVPNA